MYALWLTGDYWTLTQEQMQRAQHAQDPAAEKDREGPELGSFQVPKPLFLHSHSQSSVLFRRITELSLGSYTKRTMQFFCVLGAFG